MGTKYWLNLFTGMTWEEFLRNGASVTGFRGSQMATAQRISPGDYFICYLTGLSRFIGVLHVLSECRFDRRNPVWQDERFPIRFEVKLIYTLDAKTAVPIQSLKDRLSILRHSKSAKYWQGFLRGSLREFDPLDAEAIIEAIKQAAHKPVEREYPESLYWREPKIY